MRSRRVLQFASNAVLHFDATRLTSNEKLLKIRRAEADNILD